MRGAEVNKHQEESSHFPAHKGTSEDGTGPPSAFFWGDGEIWQPGCSALAACFSGPETQQWQHRQYLSVHFSKYLLRVSVCLALREALGSRDKGLALEGFPVSLGRPTNPKSQLSLWGAYNQQLPFAAPRVSLS